MTLESIETTSKSFIIIINFIVKSIRNQHLIITTYYMLHQVITTCPMKFQHKAAFLTLGFAFEVFLYVGSYVNVFVSLRSKVRSTFLSIFLARSRREGYIMMRGHFLSLIQVDMHLIKCNPKLVHLRNEKNHLILASFSW